jgi:hypothetical protein
MNRRRCRPVGLLSKEQAYEILVNYQKLMEVKNDNSK